MTTVPCPACGMLNEPGCFRCAHCAESMSGIPIPPTRRTCPACGSGTMPGEISLRTGGSSGVAGFFFGQLAETGETVLTLATETCAACGHVALYRN